VQYYINYKNTVCLTDKDHFNKKLFPEIGPNFSLAIVKRLNNFSYLLYSEYNCTFYFFWLLQQDNQSHVNIRHTGSKTRL